MMIRNALGRIEQQPEMKILGASSGYVKCACGKEFLKRSNRQAECAECSGKNRRQKNREYQQKCRANKKGTDVSI